MPLKDLQKQIEECSSLASNSDLDPSQATLSKSDARKELVAQIDEMAGKEDKKKVLELMSLNFNSSADVEKAKELICETLAAKEKKATTRKSKKRRLELLLALAESSDASSSKDGNAKYPLLKTNPITHALKRVRKEPITSPPSSVTSPTSIIATTSAFLTLASPSLSFTGLTSKSTTPSLRSLKSLTSSSANSSQTTTPDVCTSTQSLSSSAVTSIAVASVPALKRVRRGNRRSGSEKDSSEETTSLSEASEAESNKTEESSNSKKKSKIKSKKTYVLNEGASSSASTPAEGDTDTMSSVELSGRKLSLSSGKGSRGRGRGRGRAVDLILFGSSPDLPTKGSSIARLKSRNRLSLPYITPGSENSSANERDASPLSDDVGPTVSKKLSASMSRAEQLSKSMEAKKLAAASRRKQKQAKQDKGTVTSANSIKSDDFDEEDAIKEPSLQHEVHESLDRTLIEDDSSDLTVPVLSKKKAGELENEKPRVKIVRGRLPVKRIRKSASSSDLTKEKKTISKAQDKFPVVAAATEDLLLSRGRKRKSHASALEEDENVCTRRSRSSTPVNILANNNKPTEPSRLAKKKPSAKESIDLNALTRGSAAAGKEEITHEVLEAKQEDDIPLHSTEITAVGDDCVLKNSTLDTDFELGEKPVATNDATLENELTEVKDQDPDAENKIPGENSGIPEGQAVEREAEETEEKRLITEIGKDGETCANLIAKPTPVVATKKKKRYFRGLKYSFSAGAERKRKLAREARKAAVEPPAAPSMAVVELRAAVEPDSSLAAEKVTEQSDQNTEDVKSVVHSESLEGSVAEASNTPTKMLTSDIDSGVSLSLMVDVSSTEKLGDVPGAVKTVEEQAEQPLDAAELSRESPKISSTERASGKSASPLKRSMSVDEGTKVKVDLSSLPAADSFLVTANDGKTSVEGYGMDPAVQVGIDKSLTVGDVSLKNSDTAAPVNTGDDKSRENPFSQSPFRVSKEAQKSPVSQSPEGSHRRLSLQEPCGSHTPASCASRSPVKQPTLDFLRSLSLIRTEDVKSMREEAMKKSENRPKVDIPSLTAALNKKKKPIKLKRNNDVGRQFSSEKKPDGNEKENPYTFVASPPKPVSLRPREAAEETPVEELPAVVMRSTRRKACTGGRRRPDLSLSDQDGLGVNSGSNRRSTDAVRSNVLKENDDIAGSFGLSHNQPVVKLDASLSLVSLGSNIVSKDSSRNLCVSSEVILSSNNSRNVDNPSRTSTESQNGSNEDPSNVKTECDANTPVEKLLAPLTEKPESNIENESHLSKDSENTQSSATSDSSDTRQNSGSQAELPSANGAPEDGAMSNRDATASSGPANGSQSSSVTGTQASGSVILEGGVRKSRRIGKLHACPQLPQPLAIAAPVSADQPHGRDNEPSEDVACESLRQVLCKCRTHHNPVASLPGGPIYCQAIDSFDGRMLGCCNIVKRNTYLRVSGKIPFLLLCDIHRHRLRRHNCCPGCGLFCTQGVFLECRWSKGLTHHYHRLCGVPCPSGDSLLCPHCGSSDPPVEVLLDFKLSRKPVVYLEQHQEKKASTGARITWTSKREVSPAAAVEDTGPELELGEGGKVVSARKLAPSLDRDKLETAIISVAAGKPPNIKCTPKSLYWATKHGDLEKVLQVLAGGVDPNARLKDTQNQTGLHMAAAMGNVAITHVLVMGGAALDLTDANLFTPLMIAVQKHHNNVVHYLVAAGAELQIKTNEGMTCLHLAAKLGNLTACRHLLDSGRLSRHAINMQDEGGWTPLVWGSENRHINVVKFLLERGANAQLCDVEQNTALHWAALSGCTRICAMLLDRGCSLHSMNAYRDTPLHIAARQNHRDAVVLLLARGATLDCVNTKGQTPLECALPDTEVYLQLTLNQKLRQMMLDKKHRSNTVLSSDIAAGKEQVPIPCINGVDDEKLPRNYLYIAENTEAANINIDRSITSLKWCQCTDGCNSGDCGCTQLNFRCWYDPEGRLLPDFNYLDPPMIFECNRACGCNKLSCNNRVVQHGITAHLQLFRTTNKGWGVRALKRILKGSYVCEYVGEIITDLEADQRQDDSYLFDLDNRDSETFCLDARNYGNVARFINHLCAPNLTPVKVFLDHQDLAFPRIALYASRDIEAEEELGFDYGEKFWMIKYKEFTCTCGGETCRYSSTAIHSTLEKYRLRHLESGGCVESSSTERRPSSGESSTST